MMILTEFVYVFVDLNFLFCDEHIFLPSNLIFNQRWLCISFQITWLVPSLKRCLVFLTKALFSWVKILSFLMKLVSHEFFLEILNFFISFLERIIVKLKIWIVRCGDFGNLLGRLWRFNGFTEVLWPNSF